VGDIDNCHRPGRKYLFIPGFIMKNPFNGIILPEWNLPITRQQHNTLSEENLMIIKYQYNYKITKK